VVRMAATAMALALVMALVSQPQGALAFAPTLALRGRMFLSDQRCIAARCSRVQMKMGMGFDTGDSSSKGSGGMPGGMPGMPPGMEEIFKDPEVVAAMENPKIRQAMEEMRKGGPAAMAKYAGDPEFMQLITKVQAKMGGMANGGGMPGMPGMPPGMDKVMGDPEIMKALQNPKMLKAMMEMQMGGPAAMQKYATDPDFMNLLMKIQAKMGGGVGAPPGGMSGMGMPGFGDRGGAPKTAPGGGGFGFESILYKEPSSKDSAGTSDSASTSANSSSSSSSSTEGGLEAQLKARIKEVEKKTEQMMDQQQRDALNRLKKRKAEEDGAKQRYLDGEKKYQEMLKSSQNARAKDREFGVSTDMDPDMAKFKERVDLMKTTEKQWSEIKDMLRPIQVASGITLLDPFTNEPTPAAFVLMGMTLLVPFILVSQTFSSLVALVQALGGGGSSVDDLVNYDPGAYLPPL